MENRRVAAVALIVIGLAAVNFFYLSDVLIRDAPELGIVIGWKSALAIALANLTALAGIGLVTRDGGAV